MIPSLTISPEKVLPRSLVDICADINSQKDLQFTMNLVQAYLFSNYPERRAIAVQDIKKMWGRNTSVASCEQDGITWAYLHCAEANAYILVSKYRTADPVFEEVPDDEEREEWKKLLGQKQ